MQPRRTLSPTTRSQLFQAAVRRARALGGRPDEILRHYGLPRMAEDQPHVTLTVATVREVTQRLADTIGDACFGVHLGERLGPRHEIYPLIDYLGMSGPSLRAYLEGVVRYNALGNEVLAVTLDDQADPATFTIAIPGDTEVLGRHLNECMLANLMHKVRTLAVAPARVTRIWLAHDAPSDPAAQAEVLRVLDVPRVDFGAGTCGFALARADLDAAIPTSDPVLHGLLEDYGQKLLSTRGGGSRFLGQVRQTICDEIRERLPTIDPTARLMATSSRTLQRRLTADHTTFQALLDSVREELARALLHEAHDVGAVAMALHYSDTSTFARAFKRWAGTTPGDFQSSLSAHGRRRAGP